jgi:hypothetical protein
MRTGSEVGEQLDLVLEGKRYPCTGAPRVGESESWPDFLLSRRKAARATRHDDRMRR